MAEMDYLNATPQGMHPTQLFRILSSMVRRPGMYFPGSEKLEALDAYLMGYERAAADYGQNARLALGGTFTRWLLKKKKFKGPPNVGWVSLFRIRYATQEEALDAFLPLLQEYLKEYGSGWREEA